LTKYVQLCLIIALFVMRHFLVLCVFSDVQGTRSVLQRYTTESENHSKTDSRSVGIVIDGEVCRICIVLEMTYYVSGGTLNVTHLLQNLHYFPVHMFDAGC